ncbi:MAG: hypothetical protein R3244_08655 [Thermoanaerobaculia bacterium]|nr:hypothetical protein [Thermoanaerobaculia bacterium]
MGKRKWVSRCRTALLGAFVAALALGCEGEEPWLAADAVPLRHVPTFVAGPEIDPDGPWALFDRDTQVGWSPLGPVTLAFDGPIAVSTVGVHGSAPYLLTVRDSSGNAIAGPYDLASGSSGWNRHDLDGPVPVDGLILGFEPTGDTRAPIGELELWGPGRPLSAYFDPSTVEPAPGLADVVLAEQDRVELRAGSTACSSVRFALPRHPGVYRRAWLRFSALGAVRPWVLSRALNDGPTHRGVWVPDPSGEVRHFLYRVDVEELELGVNEVVRSRSPIPAERVIVRNSRP